MIQEQPPDTFGLMMETQDNQSIQVGSLPDLNLSLNNPNTLLSWKNHHDYRQHNFGFEQNSVNIQLLMIWSPIVNNTLIKQEEYIENEENQALDNQIIQQDFIKWIKIYSQIDDRQEDRRNCYRKIGEDIINLSESQAWKELLSHMIRQFMFQVSSRLNRNIDQQLSYNKKDIKRFLARIGNEFNLTNVFYFCKAIIDKYNDFDSDQYIHYSYKLLSLMNSQWCN